MSRKQKKILIIASVIAALLSLLMIILIAVTFYQLPLERLDSYKEPPSPLREDSSGQLESGAIVDRESLKTYLLFSTFHDGVEKWLEDKSDAVEVQEQGYSIRKDIELEPLESNQCQMNYCYQRRMSFESIPSVFWKGLIGIEDVRFLDHQGVDFKSIARAIYEDIKAMSLVQGGSTLTQQLVKNLFFTNDKSFKRKFQEIFVALYIESRYPKENILEAYFNEVFWGSVDGIRIKGLYAASLFYFGKKPKELNSYEASILISMLKGPYYYHPVRGNERLKARVNTVYERLKDLKIFYGGKEVVWDKDDWESWKNRIIALEKSQRPSAMWRTLEEEGPQVLSLFDSYILNHEAAKLLSSLKQRVEGEDIAMKVMIKDLEASHDPFKYYSKFERSKKKAFENERHQIGSLLKPIIYSAYLELGKKLEDSVSTDPVHLELLSGPWSPREASRNFPKELTIKRALQRSLNNPVIRLAEDVGMEKLENVLKERIPHFKRPLSEFPSQLLGSIELSLNELGEVFEKFIRNSCKDEKLKEILWTLSDPAQTTLKTQVDPRLASLPFFGKTGTSNDGMDNLFISYDGRYLFIVWVGLEGSRTDKALPLYGSTSAFQLYQEFVLHRGSRFQEFDCEI